MDTNGQIRSSRKMPGSWRRIKRGRTANPMRRCREKEAVGVWEASRRQKRKKRDKSSKTSRALGQMGRNIEVNIERIILRIIQMAGEERSYMDERVEDLRQKSCWYGEAEIIEG